MQTKSDGRDKCSVMDVDAAARRATLTLKIGLIDSKLPPITSAAAAKPGRRSHGWVSGVTEHGVFVGFYNKVKGLVPPAEAPIPQGSRLEDAYSVGQVIKCTVVGSDARRGLRLSLSRKPGSAVGAAAAAGDASQAADVPDGAVLRSAIVFKVEPSKADPEKAAAVCLHADMPGGGRVTARLAAEHLSDHMHAADALASAVAEGTVLPEIVVLESRPQTGLAIASRKDSLVAAAKAGSLPCLLKELKSGACVPGFIASITTDACFVRFGGGLTGRAGLPQLADAFVSDPAAHFAVGQSVVARILEVVEAQQRFTVSLKPSATGAAGSALLHCFFRCVLAALSDHQAGPFLFSCSPVRPSRRTFLIS
jgi:rRNA biogenesis protein RRP5